MLPSFLCAAACGVFFLEGGVWKRGCTEEEGLHKRYEGDNTVASREGKRAREDYMLRTLAS